MDRRRFRDRVRAPKLGGCKFLNLEYFFDVLEDVDTKSVLLSRFDGVSPVNL